VLDPDVKNYICPAERSAPASERALARYCD